MALKKIAGSIDRIKEILDRWENIPEISDIERELVLDKLKQIYEEVMFFERDAYADETIAAGAGGEHSPEPEPQTEDAMQQKQSETAPEQKQPETATGPDVKTVNPDQILFQEEIAVTPRQPVDKDTILSLYGNDPALTHMKTRPLSADQRTEPASYSPDQHKPHELPKREESPGIDEEFDLELSRKGVHAPATEKAPAAKKVFEEITGNCDDLSRTIKPNDKVLLVKELFGGDSVRYDEFITTLDTFTDLDDALIHIQETYSGNPDGEGIKLLVDLIERKLG